MKNLFPGRRVLVVEDNPVIAFDIETALRESGAEVVGPAHDIESGLALLRANGLDGAVLDIDLGGEPVWPIARALKQAGVPFVFVSGDCGKGLPDDFAGAVCLHKPAQAQAIVSSVAMAMKARPASVNRPCAGEIPLRCPEAAS